MTKQQNLSQQDVADKLLWPLWRTIDEEYKSKYLKKIWDMYEQAIRSAAYTGSLNKFLANFQKKIPVYLEVKYMKDIKLVIESDQDYDILNWLREETAYLTMLVRLRNQERKEF